MISEEENCENKNQTMLQRGITLLTVIIGNAMYAAVAVLFLLRQDCRPEERSGIALLVNRLTGLSVSIFVLGFNIVMLVVGFNFSWKKFAFTTIVSTFTYPICLELFGQIFANVHFTDDIWVEYDILRAGNRSGAWKRHSYGSIHRRYGYSSVDFEINILRYLCQSA